MSETRETDLKLSLRSPHVSRLQADALAEVDYLVREYAASDEDMTDRAAQLGATVRLYVRRWAVLCGVADPAPEGERING